MSNYPDATPLAVSNPSAVATASSITPPAVSADAASASPVSSLLGVDLGGMLPAGNLQSWSHFLNTQLAAKPYLPPLVYAALLLGLAEHLGKTRSMHHVKLVCLYAFAGGLFTIAGLDAGSLSFIQSGLKFLIGSTDNPLGNTLPFWARFTIVPWLSMPLAAAAVTLACPHASYEQTAVYAGAAMLAPLVLGFVLSALAPTPATPPSTVPTTGTVDANKTTISA